MRLIIATNNMGKLAEYQRLLEPMGIQAVSASQAGFLSDPEEVGNTFAENAWVKANALYQASGCPALADDSGLEVEALGSAPGIYSARYAGETATDEQNKQKLLQELLGEQNRKARFVCTICYIDRQGTAHYVTGSCDGTIAQEPRGTNGFGYDPLFLVGDKSFAERSDEEKDQISHRGKALREFVTKIGGWK